MKHQNETYLSYSILFLLVLLPYFSFSQIILDKNGKSPVSMKFAENDRPTVASFFTEYRKQFPLSDEHELTQNSLTKNNGGNHYKYNQSYKGIEILGAQFILHEMDGAVWYANGHIIHDLDIDVNPVITKEQAFQLALNNMNSTKYMWESKGEELALKRDLNDPNATYLPQGELKLSSTTSELTTENIKLVYRFDIYSLEPLSRYWVDVDAKTGEIVGKISRIHEDDVPGTGQSLYNGSVNMTISDAVFPPPPPPVPVPAYFHIDSWNAYGGSGSSWWVSDPELGTTGGYGDDWYQALDTDPIVLTGSNLQLSFYHRYSVEAGYDGMNMRISTDGGTTFNVLENPVPPYNFTVDAFPGNGDTYVFGYSYQQNTWSQVNVDLSTYAGQTVIIRFAFASDGAVSANTDPNLYGWQLDDILVTNNSGTLFSNNGMASGMTALNIKILQEVTEIPGNYRLREEGRSGVFTYDMHNQNLYWNATDVVNVDDNFIDPSKQVGVSAHFGAEVSYDYYLNMHGRNSLDDNGMRLISYVSRGVNYNNAFWDGIRMTYGDGDGVSNTPLVALDVVGHELTHGVTSNSSNLIYNSESGALNESFSDIFGNLIEFYVEGEPSGGINPDGWKMGEDFNVSGGFRDMANPNLNGDPDTYLGDYWWTSPADHYGVHTNSGVQNFWFYLLATGGSGTNDHGFVYAVTSIGLEDAAAIAYLNNTSFLTSSSNYQDARNGSIAAAEALFGIQSQQVLSTAAAWDAVGVAGNSPTPDIPLSNWSLLLGLVLIVTFTVIRNKKRITI